MNFLLLQGAPESPVGARPISNLTGAWLKHAMLCLCDLLQPLQNKQRHVITSSVEFLHRVKKTDLKNLVISTHDIKNYYPSIDSEDLKSRVGDQLRRYYAGKPGLSQFAVHLLYTIMDHQIVVHGGAFFKAHGIAMGNAAGVFLGNLYLDELDHTIADRPDTSQYFRFVDDSLIMSKDPNQQLQQQNAWKPESIVFESTGATTISRWIPFLDLELCISDSGDLLWRTFVKPLHSGLYVPRTSCHPPRTFPSLIAGETKRYMRTNRSIADRDLMLQRFKSKLLKRGYNAREIDSTIRDALRNKVAARTVDKNNRSFLVLTYSHTLNTRVIKRSLKKVQHLVPWRVLVGFRVQPNVFLKRYAFNWNWKWSLGASYS